VLLELSRAMNKKCFYGISKDEKAMLFKILQKIYENADRL
jgi:predicted transcriptional regulator